MKSMQERPTLVMRFAPPFAMQPSTSTDTSTFYVILAAQPIV